MTQESSLQEANTCKRCGCISYDYTNCPHCGLRYSSITSRLMTDHELDHLVKLEAEAYERLELEVPGGSCPSQYGLPQEAKELQDLIEYRDMNFALGNIFKAVYRMGSCSHSDKVRDLNKIIWFAKRELERIK